MADRPLHQASAESAADLASANANQAMRRDSYLTTDVNIFKVSDFRQQVSSNMSNIDRDGDGSLTIPELREFAQGSGDKKASAAANLLANNYERLASFGVNGNDKFDQSDLDQIQASLDPRIENPNYRDDKSVGHAAYEASKLIPNNPITDWLQGAEDDYQTTMRNYDNRLSLAQIDYFRRGGEQPSDLTPDSSNSVAMNTADFYAKNSQRIDINQDGTINKQELRDASESDAFSNDERIAMRELLKDWDNVHKIKNGKDGLQSDDIQGINDLGVRYNTDRKNMEADAQYVADHFDSWDRNGNGKLDVRDLTAAKENSTDQYESALLDRLIKYRESYGDVIDREYSSTMVSVPVGKTQVMTSRPVTTNIYGYTKETLAHLPERTVDGAPQYKGLLNLLHQQEETGSV